MWKPFLPERVLEHDGFCPTWTYRDQTAVDPKQGFDAADVTLGTGRKIFDLANIAKLGIPAVELLIHWDCALNVFGIDRKLVESIADSTAASLCRELVADADFELALTGEDIELGKGQPRQTVKRSAAMSSQPQRLGRPVVAPNSAPACRSCSPSSPCSSVGNGPAPTRVVYALAIPMTDEIAVGPMPQLTQAPAASVVEEVTNGYVPWSMSSSAPWAPSKRTC